MEVGVNATPWPLYPRGKTWYPLYRRLGGPQSRSGRVQKISALPGFDPWTVHPIAKSLYRLSYVSLYTKMLKKNLDGANICITSTELSSMHGTNMIVL